MTVNELAKSLDLKIIAGKDAINKEIKGFYSCDLLSWVISHTKEGYAWITVHTHLNVVAVAVLVELSCIIIPENIFVDVNSIEKANEEGIPILISSHNSFEISNMIGRLGV